MHSPALEQGDQVAVKQVNAPANNPVQQVVEVEEEEGGAVEADVQEMLSWKLGVSVESPQPSTVSQAEVVISTVYCLILEARATKTPAQAKKREKKHLTPAGLNADKLPPDSLTLSNFI
jgi:hypothetical protein